MVATGIDIARAQRNLVPDAGRWVVLLGRVGFLARAVVFVLMGSFLISAAVHVNSRDAKGLAGRSAAWSSIGPVGSCWD